MFNATQIASVELKRSWRQFTTDRRQLLFMALSLSTLIPIVGFISILFNKYNYLLQIYLLQINSNFLSQQLSVLTTILVFIVFLRTIQSLGSPSAPEFLLATTSPGSIVLGMLIAEWIRITLAIGIPLTIISIIMAIGASVYIIIPLIAFSTLTVVCFAVVVGYTIGMIWKAVMNHLFSFEKRRQLFHILGIISIFIAITSLTRILEWIQNAMIILAPFSPITALVNLVMTLTPLAPEPTIRTIVLTSTIVIVIPILYKFSTLLASYIWFSSNHHSSVITTNKLTEDRVTFQNTKLTKANRLEIAIVQWKRGKRSPHRFSHILYVGGTGFLGPLTIQQTALLIGAGLLLSLYAITIAIGVGTFFPKFKKLYVLTEGTVILPSTTTLGIYSMITVPSSLLFLIIIFIPRSLRLLPPFTNMTGQYIQQYDIIVLVVWFIISGIMCYKYAIRRIQNYEYTAL